MACSTVFDIFHILPTTFTKLYSKLPLFVKIVFVVLSISNLSSHIDLSDFQIFNQFSNSVGPSFINVCKQYSFASSVGST